MLSGPDAVRTLAGNVSALFVSFQGEGVHAGRRQLFARLARVLPWVAIVSFDVKCPSNTGERARWDEHDACFRMAVAAGREVYVKMPVDEGTAPEEVERGARLVAEAAPGAPLFLTPLTEPTTPRLTIGAGTLERLHALASRVHPDVRVLPQLHKVLGIP